MPSRQNIPIFLTEYPYIETYKYNVIIYVQPLLIHYKFKRKYMMTKQTQIFTTYVIFKHLREWFQDHEAQTQDIHYNKMIPR